MNIRGEAIDTVQIHYNAIDALDTAFFLTPLTGVLELQALFVRSQLRSLLERICIKITVPR